MVFRQWYEWGSRRITSVVCGSVPGRSLLLLLMHESTLLCKHFQSTAWGSFCCFCFSTTLPEETKSLPLQRDASWLSPEFNGGEVHILDELPSWVPYYLRGCRWRTCPFCTHSAAYLLPGLLCELHFWQFRAPSDLNARQYARNVLSKVAQEALELSYKEATIVCVHLFPTVQERS